MVDQEKVLYSLIWDPAVLLCCSRNFGGRRHRAWAGKKGQGNTLLLFLLRYSTEGKVILVWMKLSEEHFKCISTVASLHCRNFKPLRRLLFLQCTSAGRVCVLQSHAYRSPSQVTIEKNNTNRKVKRPVHPDFSLSAVRLEKGL